jgi:multiple sugar transport system ATP-binding protein
MGRDSACDREGDVAIVSLEHVSKRYRDVEAVRDVSFRVLDGEVMVLIGPSGCGKTTVLRLIAGLEAPDEGVIRFDGDDVREVRPPERNIAMVFEGYALYPHMRVRDNLSFALRLARRPRAEIDSRVAEVASAMELERLLGRKPGRLAMGEAQHVAVGRAVVRDTPSVLLLDDALAHLDARQRREARVEVAHLQRDLGCTVISVTHDQEEALATGMRVAVMDAGRLMQVDRPEVLYERPANIFVAGFIGSPPMNLLEMDRERVDGRLVLRRGRLEIEAPDRWAAGEVREVTAGIRPEAIRLGAARSAGEVELTARCELVEYLGSKLLLHLRVGDDGLIATTDPAAGVRVGDLVETSLALDRVHLFDTRTGEVLVHAMPRDA